MGLEVKCSHTVGEMHTILDKLPVNVKDYLVKKSLTEKQYKEYEQLLQDGSEDEIFEYERKIFDNLTPTEVDRILNNKILKDVDFTQLTREQSELVINFDKKDYPHDNTKYKLTEAFPPGKLEQAQLDYEREKHSHFISEIDYAVTAWTHGGYHDIQEIRLGIYDEQGARRQKGDDIVDGFIDANHYLAKALGDSKGLVADNMLYRRGHWDIGLKAGDVSELPCFSSTSYSAGAAASLGEGYMIRVYAPKKTKGLMIDTDYFNSDNFPEHEFLLGPGQKYIVLNVNDNHKTAEILLL